MKYKYKHIYFIGIGGISMSALAEIMLHENIKVSGSDKNNSRIIKKLQSAGARIYIGHDSKNIDPSIDLVVYTSAISDDNPELLRAQELNITIMDRAEFLGQVMKNYNHAICVSGTHGKTTTTAMLSSILMETDISPTIFLGGEMDSLGGNLLHGSNELLLTEACEYRRNFLKFNPTIELILNIDEDHLDYYKDIRDIEDAFVGFAKKLPVDGHLIVNAKNKDLFNNINCNVTTFGIEDADYSAQNIVLAPEPSYTLAYKGEKITEVKLKVFGMHNILNSLAAAATCHLLGIDPATISKGLSSFKGTHRRYEVKGNINEAVIIDDYAHHPSEMKATINTARSYTEGKVITVFQPHTYTRTKKLLNGFAEALSLSDEVILLDIYAAREINKGEVHSKDIIDKMKYYSKEASYAESFPQAVELVKSLAKKGDTVITMGAGNVDEVADMLIDSK
ncbi:MAG TPA: UDP-N-acetylmuramate--L-alanine ligase [Tissierellia bacterium]|jgi:UDP-N-acetylmuramate--alanine ligase|nr:UDP-N-acetylmuramate--L-alanine ligase [Tissierellia bacterium]